VNHFLDGLFQWKNVSQTVIMPRLFVALLFVSVLAAHHSTADYDLTRPANVTGTVTRFAWANPHSHIYLDTAAPDGSAEHWDIEIDSPRALERFGWTKDRLKPGDKITCSGARAKDGTPRMRSTQVALADGTLLQSF
jgi:Family of unknown function (DUF6152)